MSKIDRSILAVPVIITAISIAYPAYAVQFNYLDPNYTQEIYTGPLLGGPGMAWTSSGNLLTRNGSSLIEYSLTQNAVYQGTNIHGSIATHSISGLSSTGYGITKGLDGYIYTATSSGLQRFDLTWTNPAQSLANTVGGQGYGITTLPDGRIAYVAGSSTNEVYLYNPTTGLNSLIYTASSLIDDIEASATGAIALAQQPINTITIISNTGSVINAFSTLSHHPDGLAFGNGTTSTALYSNNNDGSITEYLLGAGYLGTPTITDIALQNISSGKAYGDLAAVGPDCAFYVSQFDNNGLNGSTAGVGTHWDNGNTTNEASIIRIASKSGTCAFQPSNPSDTKVPEPSNLLFMFIAAVVPLFHRLWLRFNN